MKRKSKTIKEHFKVVEEANCRNSNIIIIIIVALNTIIKVAITIKFETSSDMLHGPCNFYTF